MFFWSWFGFFHLLVYMVTHLSGFSLMATPWLLTVSSNAFWNLLMLCSCPKILNSNGCPASLDEFQLGTVFIWEVPISSPLIVNYALSVISSLHSSSSRVCRAYSLDMIHIVLIRNKTHFHSNIQIICFWDQSTSAVILGPGQCHLWTNLSLPNDLIYTVHVLPSGLISLKLAWP